MRGGGPMLRLAGRSPARHALGQTVIYEAHVRGLTLLHPKLPPALRGSFAALGHPVMIAHFKRLGITALELLPVQQHTSEPRLQRLGLINYWGYNVLAPYAPDNRYASLSTDGTPLNEFRDAVKALHQAGIEVILDVVFNHSAELDMDGPMLSLSGIDNQSYYWLTPEGDYVNDTGCGNTLRLDQPQGVAWVMDCLHFGCGSAMSTASASIWAACSAARRDSIAMRRCSRRCWRTMCCRAAS